MAMHAPRFSSFLAGLVAIGLEFAVLSACKVGYRRAWRERQRLGAFLSWI